MAKRGTLDNPKTKRLARGLGTVPGVALGLLETLWHWVGEFKKDGGVSRIDLEDAFDSGGWLGMFTFDQILNAMTDASRECVWLEDLEDGRHYIHDWHDHADDAVHRSLARAIKFFANGVRPNTSRLEKGERTFIDGKYDEIAQRAHDMRTECALPVPEPVPEPVPVPDKSPNGDSAENGATLEKGKPIPKSALFFGMLPPEKQDPKLLEAIQRNYRMRREKNQKSLTQGTLELRAKEYAEFSVEELIRAFDEATLAGWDGVFPKKSKTAPSHLNGKSEFAGVGLRPEDVAR